VFSFTNTLLCELIINEDLLEERTEIFPLDVFLNYKGTLAWKYFLHHHWRSFPFWLQHCGWSQL